MIVVANAGPLIALAQIGQFDLLRQLYGRLDLTAEALRCYHRAAVPISRWTLWNPERCRKSLRHVIERAQEGGIGYSAPVL